MPFIFPKTADSEKYWNESSISTKLDYCCDALFCEKDNVVAITISQCQWIEIPGAILDLIEGNSQFGNDIFDKLNENNTID